MSDTDRWQPNLAMKDQTSGMGITVRCQDWTSHSVIVELITSTTPAAHPHHSQCLRQLKQDRSSKHVNCICSALIRIIKINYKHSDSEIAKLQGSRSHKFVSLQLALSRSGKNFFRLKIPALGSTP